MRFLLSLFLTITMTSFAAADLVSLEVNELLPDPNSNSAANNFDTDGDGEAESTDEFIEFFNTGATGLDISGYQIWVGSGGILSVRHTFAENTNIAAGGFLVAINQFDPGTPPAGIVELDTGGSGIFGNGGDNFVLYDPTTNTYRNWIYNGDDDLMGNGLPTTATQVGALVDLGGDTDGLSIAAIPDGSTTSFVNQTPTPGLSNVAVPEPSSTTICLLGLVAACARRRR